MKVSEFTSFECIACGHQGPHEVMVSFGELPLGNNLLSEEEVGTDVNLYPLGMAFCERCTLVQAQVPISAEKFVEENLYFTSVSPSLVKHSEDMATKVVETQGLGPESFVVEVGSNDGTMLKYFVDRGIPVIGIEPVAHSAAAAEERGVPTLVELFTTELAGDLKAQGNRADVAMANDVLELAPDPCDFVRGLATLVKENGVVVIEVPYVNSDTFTQRAHA